MQQKPLYTAADYAFFFQQGEVQGFNWFFKTLYPAVTMYAFKITSCKEAAEEIASGAFIKIWQKHQRFGEEASIKAYLYRIVRNDSLKYLGKQKQQQKINKDVIYLYGNEHERDHFSSLVTAETSRELLEAISALSAECSKVFHLMYVQGKSVKEIAGLLNLSTSTIKTQKARGLAALRKKIAFIWILLLFFAI